MRIPHRSSREPLVAQVKVQIHTLKCHTNTLPVTIGRSNANGSLFKRRLGDARESNPIQ
jgi:hypothetical protein